MEAKKYLKNYYENYDENGRLQSKHGSVEFITTMHFIEKYLSPGMRVIEIGAGTGRYSHALAQKGYQVDAVELIEHNIELFRQNILPDEKVTVVQGDAREILAFERDSYDLTLLLGPMYHLFTEEDKLAALSEAIRVTKPGGVIFVAYIMSDPAVISYAFIHGQLQRILDRGMVDPVTFKAYSSPEELFELHRKEDIDRLRSHFRVTQLRFVATDGLTYFLRQTVDSMDDTEYEFYLKYHLAICERPDMTGWSNHTLDIFRKDEV